MRRLALPLAAFALGLSAGWVAAPRPDPRALAVPEAVTIIPPGGPPVDAAVYRFHDSRGRRHDLGPPPDAGAWVVSFQSGPLRYHLAAAPVTTR